MRFSAPSLRAPTSAMRFAGPTAALGLLVMSPLALGLAACSRTDDKAASPPAASNASGVARPEGAPVAGGASTLKPGLWKTVTQTPAGPEDSTQCVGEGYDPAAEAARKASPCGAPTVTRVADGFHLALSCQKDHIDYALTGAVQGDFTTTATTDLELVISAFGRKQALHMKAVSTYQGPCEPGAAKAGQ